jgi:hypothetical protein
MDLVESSTETPLGPIDLRYKCGNCSLELVTTIPQKKRDEEPNQRRILEQAYDEITVGECGRTEISECPVCRHGRTKEPETFETGATRNNADGKPEWHWSAPFVWEMKGGKYGAYVAQFLRTGDVDRLKACFEDLVDGTGMRRLCDHLKHNAPNHGPFNWAKGMPVSRCFDSLGRHMDSWMRGEGDEDHLAAFACNLMFIIHYIEMNPDLNDMPVYRELLPDE